MATISVRVIRKLDDFMALGDTWDVLLERSASNNVFLSWKWISTWCRVYLKDAELFIIMVYAGDEPVAIAPLWKDVRRMAGIPTLRTLRFLGTGDACPDYLDIIVRDDQPAEWLQPIWNELFGPLGGEWDVIEYADAPAESQALARFYRWADEDDRCLTRRLERITVCPYLPLPASAEDFRSGLSTSKRYALNKSLRHFETQGEVTFAYSASSDDLSADLDRLRDLNTRSWTERGQKGSFATEAFVRFHHDLAQALFESDQLVLCSLWVGKEYRGSFYGFQHADVLHFYIMSVERSDENRVNAGDLLLAECMEEGIRRGCREFDFLRGDEGYKYRWTGTDRRNISMSIYSRHAAAALNLAGRSAREALRGCVKSLTRSVSAPSTRT